VMLAPGKAWRMARKLGLSKITSPMLSKRMTSTRRTCCQRSVSIAREPLQQGCCSVQHGRPAWTKGHMALPVQRCPALHLCGREDDHAGCAHGRRQVGDASVVTDQQ